MEAKIVFQLDQDADGYPPIAVEMLNAEALGNGTFRLRNAPFFMPSVSFDDVVSATPTDVPNQFQFSEVVAPSRFASLSVIILDVKMDKYLMDLLRGLNCVIEYGEFGAYRVLAVAVPSSVDYQSLQDTLQQLEEQEMISFAELAVP